MTPMDDRYRYNILNVCDALHGEVCGTGAGSHTRDELIDMDRWLRQRFAEWTSPTSLYDDAVRVLVGVTLTESASLVDRLSA